VRLSPPCAVDPQDLFRHDDEQRCDAKHPCTPCIKLDEGFNCVYEQNPVTKRIREKLPPAVQPFLFSFESKPNPRRSSTPQTDSRDASCSTSSIPSPDSGGTVSSPGEECSPSASPEASRSSESDTLNESDPPVLEESPSSETQLLAFQEESPQPRRPSTEPAFYIHPYLQSPPVPRPLNLPLSSLDPERFQVSVTAVSELDLSWCALPFLGCSIRVSRELTPFD
jgi:hypothetical protein